jgi:DNA-binding NarL/FixJ family response regulator
MRHLHVLSPDPLRRAAATKRLKPHARSVEPYESLDDLRRALATLDKSLKHLVIYVPPPANIATFSQDLIALRECASYGTPASIICMSTEEGLIQSAKALRVSVILYDAVESLPVQMRAISETLGEPGSKHLSSHRKHLTPREQAVLIGLKAGLSLKEIAANLDISPNTASTYKVRLMEKLGYQNNAELLQGDD